MACRPCLTVAEDGRARFRSFRWPRFGRVFIALLVLGVGCGQPRSEPTVGPPRPEPSGALIDEKAAAHDFGPIVSRPGLKLEHSYHLRNESARDVAIRQVVNRKTCCGAVRVGKTLLRAGDETDVTVTLLVGDRFGAVVHETEVIVDPPPPRELVLRTSAEAHPALRVEGDSSVPTVVAGSRDPPRLEYRVFATGTETGPPPDLERLRLRSTVGVEWSGPKQPSAEGGELTVEARRFVVTLDSSGPPGERSAQVDLMDEDRALIRQVLAWEVVSVIVPSPRIVVFQHTPRTIRVLFRAADDRPFRVERVVCEAEGVKGRAAESGLAVVHVVEIEGTPGPARRQGVLTVVTDHPAQGRVALPYVSLD